MIIFVNVEDSPDFHAYHLKLDYTHKKKRYKYLFIMIVNL